MDIIEEMREKPNAEILLDWIEARCDGEQADALLEIREAIAAYAEGLEG
jgi:hypothetical protein